MKSIVNVGEALKEDLSREIKHESKPSIAAASFSIYAYDQLKKEPEEI